MNARLAWLLVRPSRSGLGLTLLPMVAFAVATALLLVIIGGAQAFWGAENELYAPLAALALVLMVAPLVGLGASAARLSARRRDDRLATLRLLGATSRTVGRVAVTEAVTVALAGAVVGAVLALAAAPLVALIPFRGAELTASGVILGPGWTVLVVLGVGAVAAVSASLGLRRVNLSPLGVRMRTDVPTISRTVVIACATAFPVLVGVVALAWNAAAVIGILVVTIIGAGGFAILMAILGAAGPALLAVVARRRLRRADSPAMLLSARAILESPTSAWRQVNSIAMTSVVAVVAGSGAALVSMSSSSSAGEGTSEAALLADIPIGVIVTVVASFLMSACSIGVTQAATTLDRAEVSTSLDRLGLGFESIDRARRSAVLVPLFVASLGGTAAASILVSPLLGAALIFSTTSVLVMAGALVLGVALVALGLWTTRPVLRATLAPAAAG